MAMVKTLACIVSFIALTGAVAAQDKKLTTADFEGTWNIEVMSHQIALVIEPAEGNKVTATMMAMGRDTLLKGELVDRTITLTGVPPEPGAAPDTGHVKTAPNAKPIVVTLQDDGTLTGEMMTNQGPVKWVGEKLKARKKPSGF